MGFFNRTARDRTKDPAPKPVEKITLSEKHLTLRFVLTAVFLTIGLLLIGLSVKSCLEGEAGWSEVSVKNEREIADADSFSFLYYFTGEAGERKTLQLKYSDYLKEAVDFFSYKENESEEFSNIRQLNRKLNEAVAVPENFYNYLLLFAEKDCRILFEAPVLSVWETLCAAENDTAARLKDPYDQEELAALCKERMNYAGSKKHISLEFLENSQVMLKVSDEYLSYIKEQELETVFDPGIFQNALILDYVADRLQADGYTNGILSSAEGYVRSLGTLDQTYDWKLVVGEKGTVSQIGVLRLTDRFSAVHLKPYANAEGESFRYYLYGDGSYRTPFLDEEGLCEDEDFDFYGYSAGLSLRETLEASLSVNEVFLKEQIYQEETRDAARKIIQNNFSEEMQETDFFYYAKMNIYYSQKNAPLTIVNESGKADKIRATALFE